MKFVFNPLTGGFDFVQDTSVFVPYTGAMQDLDMGNFNIFCRDITVANLLTLLNSLTVGGTETGQSSFSRGMVINDAGGASLDDWFRVETASRDDAFIVDATGNTVSTNVPTLLKSVKSGATQAGAGAAVGEIWRTSGHATLPDNVLMIGV